MNVKLVDWNLEVSDDVVDINKVNASNINEFDSKMNANDIIKNSQDIQGNNFQLSNKIDAGNGNKGAKGVPKSNDNMANKYYLNSDKGPYFVHMYSMQEGQELHDATIGLRLKSLRVKGTNVIKKISRRELKVVFNDAIAANEFMKSSVPMEIKVRAEIPKYNILKVGIIFDIPTKYGDYNEMNHIPLYSRPRGNLALLNTFLFN